jgi:thioredoxin-related protein
MAPGATAPGVFARVVLVMVLVLGAAYSAAEDSRDPYAHFFTATFGDLPEEMATARTEGKLGMLLFFEADACPYCEHMRRKVLNQPHVQDWFRERFVNIAVDIHGDIEVKDFDGITLPMKVFAEHRRVYMTPVMSFVDPSGAEIYRHLGMIRTPEEFLMLGEYIEGRHYYDLEFKVFAERKGMQEEEIYATPAGESE